MALDPVLREQVEVKVQEGAGPEEEVEEVDRVEVEEAEAEQVEAEDQVEAVSKGPDFFPLL